MKNRVQLDDLLRERLQPQPRKVQTHMKQGEFERPRGIFRDEYTRLDRIFRIGVTATLCVGIVFAIGEAVWMRSVDQQFRAAESAARSLSFTPKPIPANASLSDSHQLMPLAEPFEKLKLPTKKSVGVDFSNPIQRTKIAAVLAPYDGALDKLEAAAQMQQSPVRQDLENPNINFTWVSSWQHAASFLDLRAALLNAQGHPMQALKALQASTHMGEALTGNGVLILDLVGDTIQSKANEVLFSIAESHPHDSAVLNKVKQIATDESTGDVTQVIRGETAFGVNALSTHSLSELDVDSRGGTPQFHIEDEIPGIRKLTVSRYLEERAALVDALVKCNGDYLKIEQAQRNFQSTTHAARPWYLNDALDDVAPTFVSTQFDSRVKSEKEMLIGAVNILLSPVDSQGEAVANFLRVNDPRTDTAYIVLLNDGHLTVDEDWDAITRQVQQLGETTDSKSLQGSEPRFTFDTGKPTLTADLSQDGYQLTFNNDGWSK